MDAGRNPVCRSHFLRNPRRPYPELPGRRPRVNAGYAFSGNSPLHLRYSFYPSCLKSHSQGDESGHSPCFSPGRSGNQCSNYNDGCPVPGKTFGSPLSGSDFTLCPRGRNPAGLVLLETRGQRNCNRGNCKRITSRRPEGIFCGFTASSYVIRNFPQGKRM